MERTTGLRGVHVVAATGGRHPTVIADASDPNVTDAQRDAVVERIWQEIDRMRRGPVRASPRAWTHRPQRSTRSSRKTTARRVSAFRGGGKREAASTDDGGGEPPSPAALAAPWQLEATAITTGVHRPMLSSRRGGLAHGSRQEMRTSLAKGVER